MEQTLPSPHVQRGSHLACPSLPERKHWVTREGTEAQADSTGPPTLPGVWALGVIQAPAPWRMTPRAVKAGRKPCAQEGTPVPTPSMHEALLPGSCGANTESLSWEDRGPVGEGFEEQTEAPGPT